MNQSPVLITGAAGFIGSHLAQRFLSEGRHVIGLDNLCDFYDPAFKRRNIADATADAADRFTLVECDIRDREAVFKAFEKYQPDSVVHLAAMAGVRPSIARPDYYTAVNLDGTVNMLDAAVKTGVKKFAFASSSSVYGNNDKVPFSEEDRVDFPISPYAATKKSGELICHTYWHIHHLPIVCLRFFTVFGPRQRPDLAISKFLRLVRDGQPIQMFGDGSTSRDYTYVEDIVTGVCASLNHCSPEVGYRVYNLGGSSPVSLRELIETIERVVGKPANVEQKPMQPGDVQRTFADIARSQTELGYSPTTSLADGIVKQWQWIQSL